MSYRLLIADEHGILTEVCAELEAYDLSRSMDREFIMNDVATAFVGAKEKNPANIENEIIRDEMRTEYPR